MPFVPEVLALSMAWGEGVPFPSKWVWVGSTSVVGSCCGYLVVVVVVSVFFMYCGVLSYMVVCPGCVVVVLTMCVYFCCGGMFIVVAGWVYILSSVV